MIYNIGCDIVEHKKSRELDWEVSPPVLQRIFSNEELEISSTIAFLSGRFAGKEAILKCLGMGMQDGIALTDIQILQSDLGSPVINLSGYVKKIADEIGITSWSISISHSDQYSIAFVISEK